MLYLYIERCNVRTAITIYNVYKLGLRVISSGGQYCAYVCNYSYAAEAVFGVYGTYTEDTELFKQRGGCLQDREDVGVLAGVLPNVVLVQLAQEVLVVPAHS